MNYIRRGATVTLAWRQGVHVVERVDGEYVTTACGIRNDGAIQTAGPPTCQRCSEAQQLFRNRRKLAQKAALRKRQTDNRRAS